MIFRGDALRTWRVDPPPWWRCLTTHISQQTSAAGWEVSNIVLISLESTNKLYWHSFERYSLKFLDKILQHGSQDSFDGHRPPVYPHVYQTSCMWLSQASPLCFSILQVIKNCRQGRPGNEAKASPWCENVLYSPDRPFLFWKYVWVQDYLETYWTLLWFLGLPWLLWFLDCCGFLRDTFPIPHTKTPHKVCTSVSRNPNYSY